MNLKQLFIIFILLAAIALLLYDYALAGITVTPDRHIVYLSPGEEQVVMYNIENSGDEDIDIAIEPKAWSGVKDVYKWLSLESNSIYGKAGENTPLIVKLNVPEDITGEQVAMLFLVYKDSMNSQLNIRNGVPLYMIVKATEDYSLNIEDIEVSYTRKNDFLDLNYVVKIKNTGNVHIVPNVKVVIEDSEGRALNTMSLMRPNIVLRDQQQAYRLGWREPGLRDGIYSATAILDYEDKIAPYAKRIKFQVAGSKIEKIDDANTGD